MDLYWGSSTNYSYFTVSEAPYVANSVTVNNLESYYPLTPVPALTTVTQGDSNIPMLKLDLYSNVAGGASWTGGKLDRVGTNTSVHLNDDEPGDVTFSVYKDANGDGLFKSSDTLVGGPYRFDQLTGQNYILTVPQTITDTPARYFIIYKPPPTTPRSVRALPTAIILQVMPPGCEGAEQYRVLMQHFQQGCLLRSGRRRNYFRRPPTTVRTVPYPL